MNSRNTAVEKTARASRPKELKTPKNIIPSFETALIPSDDPKFLSPSFDSSVDLRRSPLSGIANVSSLQAQWLSHRQQSSSDAHATQLLNTELGLDPPLTKEIIDEWWRSDNFCSLAAGVISTPSVPAFLRIADTLFPTAYRALNNLLSSKSANANARGLELLFRLHGMLIDRVQHEAPEAIESIAESLRQLNDVMTVEVYSTPKKADELPQNTNAVDGEYTDLNE